MAVKVDAGVSTIRFEYLTPGLADGLIITGGACAILLAYILIFSIYSKHRRPDEHYPEGDRLIKKWREQDLEEARRLLAERFPQDIKPSLLDDEPGIQIPHIENGFSGGFRIDPGIYDDKDDE